jgi:Mg-chelatase subunit ChlD
MPSFAVICPFTRDYDSIRMKLRMLEEFDKTCLEGALLSAYHLILSEWGHQTHTHIILVRSSQIIYNTVL